jgi:hypothetical protein
MKQILQYAGFETIEAERILYTSKTTHSAMLSFLKGQAFAEERLPVINAFATIRGCKDKIGDSEYVEPRFYICQIYGFM